MKIWSTTFRSTIIKLFVADYTWCCAFPFFDSEDISRYHRYSYTIFLKIELENILVNISRKKLNLLLLKASLARTELKIVNFSTSCLNTKIVAKSLLILDMIGHDIANMFFRKVYWREAYQRYSKWNKEQLFFFRCMFLDVFFVVISNKYKVISRSQFFREFIFFDSVHRNLMTWSSLNEKRKSMMLL